MHIIQVDYSSEASLCMCVLDTCCSHFLAIIAVNVLYFLKWPTAYSTLLSYFAIKITHNLSRSVSEINVPCLPEHRHIDIALLNIHERYIGCHETQFVKWWKSMKLWALLHLFDMERLLGFTWTWQKYGTDSRHHSLLWQNWGRTEIK